MYQSSKVKYLIGKKFSEQGNNLTIKLVGWNLVIEEGGKPSGSKIGSSRSLAVIRLKDLGRVCWVCHLVCRVCHFWGDSMNTYVSLICLFSKNFFCKLGIDWLFLCPNGLHQSDL